MLSQNDKKEEFSLVYVSAVSAMEGFAFEVIRRDRDSVDAVIRSNKKLRNESVINFVNIEVQLKATSVPVISEGILKFVLPLKNYNDLRARSTSQRFLIVFVLPPNEADWLSLTTDQLILKKCSYWFSLKGMGETTNEDSVTINIPEANIFDNNKLKQILTSISTGEEF